METGVVRTVPHGYEEEKKSPSSPRGTLIYYDAFEQATDEALAAALDRAADVMRSRSFAKLALYPLHEQTVRRMRKRGPAIDPYYKREARLFEWRRERGLDGSAAVVVENWEGKRKKYTPVEAALRHLAETYPAPLFLYVSPDTANAFASYASFDEWIAKLRLLLSEPPEAVHPKLERRRDRWDA